MSEPAEEAAPGEPEPAKPKQGKGSGCALGGIITVGSLFALPAVLAGLVTAIPSGAGRTITAVIVGVLPIALLVAAGVYWRKTPGFLLGIGLTIGITLALFTGCIALIAAVSA